MTGLRSSTILPARSLEATLCVGVVAVMSLNCSYLSRWEICDVLELDMGGFGECCLMTVTVPLELLRLCESTGSSVLQSLTSYL